MKQRRTYLFLTIALAVSLFLSAFRQPVTQIFGGLFFLISLIASAISILKVRRQFLVLLGLAAATQVPIWLTPGITPLFRETINNAIWLVLISYVGVLLFRDISSSRQIRSNEIYGAISVYLLIGVFFGIIYQTILLYDPGAIYFHSTNFGDLPPGDGDVIYYSFITLSTVGYGDASPAAPLTRSISIIEAILGIMYIATMIARFVASHKSASELAYDNAEASDTEDGQDE